MAGDVQYVVIYLYLGLHRLRALTMLQFSGIADVDTTLTQPPLSSGEVVAASLLQHRND